MEENCLICYDKCRPDFNTYLTQNSDLKAEVCNLVCEIYKLSNTNLILDLKNYFNFCQLCFDDLTRVHRTFKSLKRLQELLKKDREELDNRIRESHKRFRIVPAKNRVINSVRDEIIRKISDPKNAQSQTPSMLFGFLSNEEPEGIIISNEISQEEEDPLQNLDDLSPILGDVLEEEDVKFSINDERLPEIHPIKLPKAVLELPRLPEGIPDGSNILNHPLIQAFIQQSQRKQPIPNQKRLKRQASQPTNLPKQIYNCFFCEKSYNHIVSLFNHKNDYHKDNLYPCSEGSCSDQFPTLKDLNIHQRRVHNIHKYECKYCLEILGSLDAFYDHKKTHHSNAFFVCPVSSCAKEFSKKHTLNNHIKKHENQKSEKGPEPTYTCTEDGCGKVLKTKSQLRNHKTAYREKKQTYPCPFEGCDRIFKTRGGRRLHYLKVHSSTSQDLISHLQRKHGGGIKITDFNNRKEPSATRVRSVPKPHNDTIVEKVKPKAIKPKILSKPRKRKKQIGSWLCEFCSKIFSNKQHLNAHLKHQHPPGGKTSFKCTDCPKSFFYKNSLKEHINQIHLKIFNHYCDQCGLGYYSLHQLNTHRKMHFLTVSCRLCPRKFAFTCNRNKHELSHSSENTFKCSQCPASFKRAVSLKDHKIIQHPPKDVEPFVCVKCGQKFKIQRYLGRHIRERCGK